MGVFAAFGEMNVIDFVNVTDGIHVHVWWEKGVIKSLAMQKGMQTLILALTAEAISRAAGTS